jgi:hypothetical protein
MLRDERFRTPGTMTRDDLLTIIRDLAQEIWA